MITLDKLIEVAREVGEIHRVHHRKVKRETKDVAPGVNPDVTVVDTLSEKHIIEFAKKEGITLIGEEFGTYDARSQEKMHADPLDGTTSYIMGKKYSAVSIGVERKDELIMGVVYNALTNQMYTAEIGAGAYIEEQDCNDPARTIKRRLETKDTGCIDDTAVALPALRSFMRYSKNQSMFKDIVLNTWRICSEPSIALNLCDVAEGIFDIALAYRVGGTWDYSAGAVIVREAGGICTDWSGKNFVPSMAKGNIIPSYLAAANKDIHEKFIERFIGGY
jgi:myo-inositol-1(or 4)-monophosphatase